jgi:hypothetical protein
MRSFSISVLVNFAHNLALPPARGEFHLKLCNFDQIPELAVLYIVLRAQ